ncbi:cytochrome P450 [Hydrogenophaga sp.]|uniref:cytochrome P450 n=1 Tax=Hydrogenophaga sp. TaxID=1904254 RepID=UPI0026059A09|nr:cytochrome P450 [Hydrogenophaga sp.]MCW5653218.1 cytochrome P450 [Hydrogenophaga sp.]
MSEAVRQPRLDVDLYTQAIFRDPYPELERIRAAGPVVWNGLAQGWMLTSDALIRRTLTNFDRFTLSGAPPQRLFGAEAFIVIDDKPQHDRLRNVWAPAFQRQAVARLQPAIEKIVDDMLAPVEERLRAGETVDVFKHFCRDIPAYVIAAMLGLPDSARPDIVRWSDLMGAAVISPPSADGSMTPAWIAGEQAKQELGDFLVDQMNHRRRHRSEDLISQMVHSEPAQEMSDDAIMKNCRQLLFAGNETTAKWMGHIVAVLHDHPDARRAVAADPALLPDANEEVMRFEPVVHRSHRRVRGGPVTIEGVDIPDGDLIILLMGAGNRDPQRYERPQEFDIRRTPMGNLGFGFGMHSCLGISLARLEATIAIRRLLARLPDYRVAGEIGYEGLGLRGPSPLPVAL